MKKILILYILLFAIQVHGQSFYTDLYGFRLGQYREAANIELGNPYKSGIFDDGFVYEAFLLKPDTSLYIVFEYSARDTNIIWSIQVSGTNTSTDIGFKNAKFGIDESQSENVFGKPSSIEDIGKYGSKWVYDNTNFSIEINKNGKFSSIKILDNSNELYATGPDITKIPSFDKIQKVLTSSNNSEILDLLSGDIEIYANGKTYYFIKSFKTELSTDYSKVISLIKEISKDLSSVDTKNTEEYEENMRLALGEDIKHVIKIKKGHIIKEIVLKYYGGKYLIFEINANSK